MCRGTAALIYNDKQVPLLFFPPQHNLDIHRTVCLVLPRVLVTSLSLCKALCSEEAPLSWHVKTYLTATTQMEVDTLNNGLPYTIAFFFSFLLHFCSILPIPQAKSCSCRMFFSSSSYSSLSFLIRWPNTVSVLYLYTKLKLSSVLHHVCPWYPALTLCIDQRIVLVSE